MLAHPEVATRDCGDCQLFVYNEDTGERAKFNNKPVPRPPGTGPPCTKGPDICPKGSPTAGRELTTRNWLAYLHYQQCKATGNFPDDSIVSRNAGVIRQVEDSLS